MTIGNVMFAACVLFVVVGTVGLIRDIKVKRRQRKQAKHYAAMRESAADNE